MKSFLSNPPWGNIASRLDDDDLKERIMTGGSRMDNLPHTPITLINTDVLIEKALVFGCGIGRNFEYYNTFIRDVYAYDLSPMIDRCSKLCDEEVTLLTSDWNKISDNFYDLTIAQFVLQHFTSTKELKEFLADISNKCSYLYVVGRSFMDDSYHSNVFQGLIDSEFFDVIDHDENLNTMYSIKYPLECHGQILLKSVNHTESSDDTFIKRKPVKVKPKQKDSSDKNPTDTVLIRLAPTTIFTIANDAYFAKASVFIDSADKFADGCSIVKVCADKDYVGTEDKAIELGLYDVELPSEAIDFWRAEGDQKDLRIATRLCTAIKPKVFEWCFNHGASRVIYIDPDCKLYGNLDDIFDKLLNHEIVLFPHLLEARVIQNAKHPEELLLKVGVYNCGVVGMSDTKNVRHVLDWWSRRILYDCEDTEDNFTFTDQSWASLMPGLATTHIERNPEYNVAWWNAHERKISYGSKTQVNKRDLKIYHFSGYEVNNPTNFSRHINSDIPDDQRRLFIDYSKDLLQTEAIDLELRAYGYFDLTSGYSGASRDVCSLLENYGASVEKTTLGGGCADVPKEGKISIWFTNADTMRHDVSRYSSCHSGHRVAYWCWELENPPSYLGESVEIVDEIWVPSTFVKNSLHDTIKEISPNKSIVVVPPFEYDQYYETHEDKEENEKTSFFFAYDTRSSWERKNPYSLIKAFKQAFKPNEAALTIKVLNLDETPEHRETLYRLAEDHSITIIEKKLSREDYIKMLRSSDVYVSMHRSEGFGKTIVESMSNGIPTIVTSYGGNMDINTHKNSILLPYDIVEIEEDIKIHDNPVYLAGNVWADPNVAAASESMRRLHLDKDLRKNLGEVAKENVWRLLNPTSLASKLIERLRTSL